MKYTLRPFVMEDCESLAGNVGMAGRTILGCGIMTNVVREFCVCIFANTDMIHLFATVAHYNPASIRVIEKAGFSKVGVRHRAAIKNNVLVDIHIYELVKIK